VDRTGCDEGVDTFFRRWRDGFTRDANIALGRASQRADGRFFDDFGDRFDRFGIARTGGGKAGFNNVHAELFQLASDADFFFTGHGSARALFAVAQSGIEEVQTLAHGALSCGLLGRAADEVTMDVEAAPLARGQLAQAVEIGQRDTAAFAPFVDGCARYRLVRKESV